MRGQCEYLLCALAPRSLWSSKCVVSVNASCVQLLVTARDTGNPDIVVSESVQINVLRNLFAPVFSQNSYSASVYDYASVGSSVVRVEATDSDITVSQWRGRAVYKDGCFRGVWCFERRGCLVF